MNAIAAFQMAKAIDDERRDYVERRRRRAESAESDVRYRGRHSWRAILRFPRLTSASSNG